MRAILFVLSLSFLAGCIPTGSTKISDPTEISTECQTPQFPKTAIIAMYPDAIFEDLEVVIPGGSYLSEKSGHILVPDWVAFRVDKSTGKYVRANYVPPYQIQNYGISMPLRGKPKCLPY